MTPRDLLRQLPAIDALMTTAEALRLVDRHGRPAVVAAARRELERARAALLGGDDRAHRPIEAVIEAMARELHEAEAGRLVDVINATGVLVHTNLGRASLGRGALDRLIARAAGSTNLEMDLATGRRGRRAEACEDLLVELSGADAGLVVNNNAAALLLALNTFAGGKGVLVSRGELVEIGGSFRLPAICERSGARLVEVGTTNRTRIADFAGALDDRAGEIGLILKIHPSNFRVVGFTEEAPLAELVALGRGRGIPVVMDQGSGALEDLSPWGVEGEPSVPSLVAEGADLVLFSGDKLLGGPQAGCAVGTRAAVAACRENPLYRALRVGRLVAVALEATLWAHACGRVDDVPVLAQIRLDPAVVRERAERLAAAIAPECPAGVVVDVAEDASTSGGGSSPTSRIPTWVVRIGGLDPDALAARLRLGRPAVIGRISAERFLIDPRSMGADRDADVASLVSSALARSGTRR